ncbi:hypothetical protein BJY52DRAFT_1246289 [Lactarius psammicola]|nr:hypothetical protein BJY52DRAFT_1246289 [Lactarius psammicola]
MLPRSSVDVLASAVRAIQKPKRAASERMPSGYEGEILSLDEPSLDLTCGTSNMAPGSFETHIYSLQSTFRVFLGQQPRPDQLENSPAQGCFALEGSSAAARQRANTVPWNQGLDFKQSNSAKRQKTGGKRKSENNIPSAGPTKKQKVSDALATPAQANTTRSICMRRWNQLQPGGRGLAADFDAYYKALSDAEIGEMYKRRDATAKAVANKENILSDS